MRRRGHPDTKPAPSHAPATAAPIINTSVDRSTSTARMKMKASAKVGTVCPTFNVPGMFASSFTARPNLNSDVVVANDPIPSVSKKSVTAPITSCAGVGQPTHLARACLNQKMENATATAASATYRAVFACIAPILTPERARPQAIRPAQSVLAGQMMAVVTIPPVPVVQPAMHLFVCVSQIVPTSAQAQNTCWPQ